MSITLLLAVIFIVAALVGFKVYFEEKLEKAEKDINDAVTEAVKEVEQHDILFAVQEPVKVEEVVEEPKKIQQPEKKKKPSKKRYYRPNNKKKTNKTK